MLQVYCDSGCKLFNNSHKIQGKYQLASWLSSPIKDVNDIYKAETMADSHLNRLCVVILMCLILWEKLC